MHVRRSRDVLACGGAASCHPIVATWPVPVMAGGTSEDEPDFDEAAPIDPDAEPTDGDTLPVGSSGEDLDDRDLDDEDDDDDSLEPVPEDEDED